MHIAFLTPEYPHPKIATSAGIGTSIKNLAVALVKNKHQVTVFVYSQNSSEIIEVDGIVIHKITHKKYSIGGWYWYRKYLQKYINSEIKKEGIELVEAPDWTGVTAFMNLKCPLIIRLHGTDAYFCHLEGRQQKLKNYWFEKLALKNATKIVSVSKFTAQKTVKLFDIKKAVEVIYNGINTDKFSVSDYSLILPNSILYFGSIIRKKGVLELAHIFNEVIKIKPEIRLQLIGKDVEDIFFKTSTKAKFLELLSEKALNQVDFFEEVPYSDIQSYISKAGVVVMPSFAEAFPMTWLEAMAMGKAMVTSNIGWAKELMIDGQTGYTVNPKTHKEYATKIVELINNVELNHQFGINARKRILENFSEYVISKKNIEYYKSIIKTK